jgi:hypothetical protein
MVPPFLVNCISNVFLVLSNCLSMVPPLLSNCLSVVIMAIKNLEKDAFCVGTALLWKRRVGE